MDPINRLRCAQVPGTFYTPRAYYVPADGHLIFQWEYDLMSVGRENNMAVVRGVELAGCLFMNIINFSFSALRGVRLSPLSALSAVHNCVTNCRGWNRRPAPHRWVIEQKQTAQMREREARMKQQTYTSKRGNNFCTHTPSLPALFRA